MYKSKLKCSVLVALILGVMVASAGVAAAAEPVELYTPYTSLYVTPGESVNYSLDIMNQSSQTQIVDLSINGLPSDWHYEFKSSLFTIQEIAVKANDSRNITLTVDIPLEVDRGTYRFSIVSHVGATLPLELNVTEQGTYKTELSVKQPNLEGTSDAKFTYTAEIENKTAETQTYALRHSAPRGWVVQFKSGINNVTSVEVEPNSSTSVTIDMTPALDLPADTYTIPIEAVSGSTGDRVEVEAVITGTYRLELNTATGRLNADVTAGNERSLDIVVKNSGTTELSDINLTAQTPVDWEVTFDEKTIEALAAGESKHVTATIKASDKAISGDYVVVLNARTPEASSQVELRTAVKASVLWGWIGILIIAAVLGALFYLFRKYGRR